MNLTPKNWTAFQHYKNRSPSWIKLHRRILDDFEFHCLPVASKALAPLLWLLASEYENGKITASAEELSFRLRTTQTALIDALKPLVSKGFFTSDSDLLADCYQDAILEKRREEKEIYREEKRESRVSRRKARKPIPDDWKIDEQDRNYVQDKGFVESQILTIGEAFANHHRAKGNLMADWHAAWRTWVNNEIKFQRNINGGGNGKAIKVSPIIEHVEKRIRQFEDIERGSEPLGGGLAGLLSDRRS